MFSVIKGKHVKGIVNIVFTAYNNDGSQTGVCLLKGIPFLRWPGRLTGIIVLSGQILTVIAVSEAGFNMFSVYNMVLQNGCKILKLSDIKY